MKTIFHVRPKGFNVGNDAIATALLPMLRSVSDQPLNIITIPATAKYDGGIAGLTKQSIFQMNQFGDGVLVGGGNILENGELDIDIAALNALQIPMMTYSISSGRIFDRAGKLAPRTDTIETAKARALFQQTKFPLVRDNATVNFLRDCGVEAEWGGCPTVLLNEEVEIKRSIDWLADKTLLSIRTPDLMSIPPKDKRRCREDIGKIIDLIGKKNLIILCHDIRDIAFASSYDVPYLYTGDVHEYLAWLTSCRLLITYRLHAFLPALSYNVPTIKISYDERAISLLDDVGLGEWNINMMKEGVSVLDEVVSRQARLSELNQLRNQLDPIWRDTKRKTIQTMAAFVADL